MQKTDYLYDTANLNLCKPGCLCKAGSHYNFKHLDNSDWPAIHRPKVITSSNGKSRFPECPAAKTINMTFWGTEWNQNVTKGYNALKGVENSFECAGMCKVSYLYSFSDVAKYN